MAMERLMASGLSAVSDTNALTVFGLKAVRALQPPQLYDRLGSFIQAWRACPLMRSNALQPDAFGRRLHQAPHPEDLYVRVR